MNSLHPPASVVEIADHLEAAGFEAWCVGGAIRDALLGHAHLDWDLATSATPTQVRDLFGGRRTIPIGIEFGTVGVLDRDGVMHELTTFRRDVRTDGRHAEVEFGVSLEDDLARRDFTINAIAYSPRLRETRDPFGGLRDLGLKIVRAVGDANARMLEDRLRALRAIRFSARFDFAIDDATYAAIVASAPFLGRLSSERIKQELDKTLEQVARPSRAFAVWRAVGAFRTLIPAIADLPESSFAVSDYLAKPGPASRPSRRANRFAGLLLDLTPQQAGAVLAGLRASKVETQAVVDVIARWRTFGTSLADSLAAATTSDAQVRTWVAGIGRLQIGAVMRVANAAWAVERAAGRPAPSAESVRRVYRRMLASAYRDPIDLGSLAVDGDDLRRSGIPPGPGLGKILQALLAAVIEDPARNETDWLLQEARQQNERLQHERR